MEAYVESYLVKDMFQNENELITVQSQNNDTNTISIILIFPNRKS